MMKTTVTLLTTLLLAPLAALHAAETPAPSFVKTGVILVNHVGFPPNAAKHCVIPDPPEKEFTVHRLKDTKFTQVFAGTLMEGGKELEPGWVGDFTLAIPLTAVDRTLELRCEDLTTVAGEKICRLNDETLPVIPIGQILNINTEELDKETMQLFITSLKGQKTAIQVDQILGHQEIFVKTLPRPLSAIKGISGVSVLGNGEIAFILDIRNKF